MKEKQLLIHIFVHETFYLGKYFVRKSHQHILSRFVVINVSKSLFLRCLNVVFSVETCVFHSSFRINSLHNFDKSIKRWKKRLVYAVLKEDYGLNKVVLAILLFVIGITCKKA